MTFNPEKHSDLIALLPSEEYSIADLARSIASNFGDRQVIFDTTKADG